MSESCELLQQQHRYLGSESMVRPYYDSTQYLCGCGDGSQAASPLDPAARERHGRFWLQLQRKDQKVGLSTWGCTMLSPVARRRADMSFWDWHKKIAAAYLFGPFYHFM